MMMGRGESQGAKGRVDVALRRGKTTDDSMEAHR
jgi:hypothetical protein